MSVQELTVSTKRNTLGRWVLLSAAGIIAFVVIASIVTFLRWPYTRQAVSGALRKTTGHEVEIQSFRQTYFPPGCVAEQITFLPHGTENARPITIQRLILVGTYADLLSFTHRVNKVVAIGFHVMVPPKGSNEKGHAGGLLIGGGSNSYAIGSITAESALFEFLPSQAEKSPYRIQFQHLTVGHIDSGGPLSFRASLSISQPPAEILSEGKVGPWNPSNLADTNVSGSFTLRDAKLDVFRGITGAVAAQGRFSGKLGSINVDGDSDVPNFRVSTSSHTIDLKIKFHAIVNGTNGDTFLQPAGAHFLGTDLDARGGIVGNGAEKGKTVSLDLAVNDGRADDFFRLFTRSPRPPIAGRVVVKAKALLPPGPGMFLKKLHMEGDFSIPRGQFLNPKTENFVNVLSKTAEGKSKEQAEDDPRNMLSDLQGHAIVQNGVTTFTRLDFSVPGAHARMHGTYNLLTKRMNLHGKLFTEGNISDTQSGIKSLFLKVITPFLKKKGTNRVIPFKITGTYQQHSMSLDF